jgi:hypothetical protein
MKSACLAQRLAFFAMIIMVTSPAAANDPFSVEVVDSARDVPLGLPFEAVARISNVSGKTQPTAFFHALLKLKVVDGPPKAMDCLTTSKLEGWDLIDVPEGLVADLYGKQKSEVPVGWTTDVPRAFLPPEPGEYTLVFEFTMAAGTETWLGEPEDNWVGEVSSSPVKVRVIEPQGSDAETFEWYSNLVPEDYCCSRARRFASAFNLPFRNAERADILRRFPESVYTANYVINDLLQLNLNVPPEYIMRTEFGRDINDFHDTVPCPPPERCLENGTVYLRGVDYLNWKLAWCDKILEDHPNVWFADDVRYVRAIYLVQSGDMKSCEAGLVELVEHGRPYAAERAGELLADMKAKGMLEENTK